jgi:hypothetical protein
MPMGGRWGPGRFRRGPRGFGPPPPPRRRWFGPPPPPPPRRRYGRPGGCLGWALLTLAVIAVVGGIIATMISLF